MDPITALHRLRKLYRDAHHCDPATDQHVITWAKAPELWAEHQIRFRGWSWYATEATVRECRRLVGRAERVETQQQDQEPKA
jgi:hypothetical protein